MINYRSFNLDNGLNVLVYENHSFPVAVTNIIYDVGSKDEHPEKTGFAHLFEHLMFEGSLHIPKYDESLEKSGGESNAFTTPDVTNYYITLPAVNLETAFWLESDRMLELAFNPERLEIQRKVVIEEFKQCYLNQPYGDSWMKILALAYKKHPYRWATIGKGIAHIEQVKMKDIQSFYHHYYHPANAIMVVAGKVTTDQVYSLTKKWFDDIPSRPKLERKLPSEPVQEIFRKQTIIADVPLDMICKIYHTCGRLHPDYHATDLLSDILGNGKSSRLYQKLVNEQKIFTEIEAWITASFDPGILLITGKLNKGISLESAEDSIDELIEKVKKELISDKELEKVKNRALSALVLQEMELLTTVVHLAHLAVLNQPHLINTIHNDIQSVSKEAIEQVAHNILTKKNSSTLYYKSKNI